MNLEFLKRLFYISCLPDSIVINVLGIKISKKLKFKKNKLININGYNITVPGDHAGSKYYNLPFYSRNYPRLVNYIQSFKYPDLKIIDVGANVGDGIALLRKITDAPILCVEGDNYYYNYLKTNSAAFENIACCEVLLGDKTEKINIDMSKENGTGRLVKTDKAEKTIYKFDEVIKENPDFAKAKFIKIDTDGYDNKIIRGSLAYIEQVKPVIFFEYDPKFLLECDPNGGSIFKILNSLGYNKVLCYQNTGEYMFSLDMNKTESEEELNLFLRINSKIPYSDLCVFHSDDFDLYDHCRKSEIKFFNDYKM